MNSFLASTLIQVCFFMGSFLLSTILIRFFIIRVQRKAEIETTPKDTQEQAATTKKKPNKVWLKDTGFWIGFFEHIVIFVFVANKEFSALAIIFGAKEFVRKEDIVKNPAYYLLGTLINFGIALLAIELYLKIYHG